MGPGTTRTIKQSFFAGGIIRPYRVANAQFGGVMDTVQKALWHVESNLRTTISLEEIASVSGVSAFHLTRAFAAALGTPLIRYARRRRLSEAARQLADGAKDILSVAIDYGYGSHEAFSRAFKEEFQVTPESVRAQMHCDNLEMTAPIAMSTTPVPNLGPPRIETLAPMRLAGIVEQYDCDSLAGIPDQWQRFRPHLGTIEYQIGRDTYGVCYNHDDDGRFDYMSGVEVADYAQLPVGLVSLDLPEQKFAVFSHDGHVSDIRAVISASWNNALPASSNEVTQGPTFEKYGEQFDGSTGFGGFEIWIAVM